MEPTGVWLPAGDRSTAVPQGYSSLPSGRAAVSAVSLRDALSCARVVAVGHRHHVTSPLCHCCLGQRKELPPPGTYLCFIYTSSDAVTSSGCTQCHSWQKCQTRAGGCREGSGLVGISSGEWSTGSGWLVLIQCAVGNQWSSVKDSDIYTVT